jgi:DNA-binding helix-hairpin-helix protein with protein kinase domain
MSIPGQMISTYGKRSYKLATGFPPGGQGTVFLLDGYPLVAKLYHPELLENGTKEKQYRYLMEMISAGPPSNAFVWPEDIVENPSLGYIMKCVPNEYQSLSKLNQEASNADLRTRLRICYRLAEAFSVLHNRKGYAYSDLSPGNVLCHPKTGEISIIDNDNLAIDGISTPLDVIGTPHYIAPELETGRIQRPNIETDLHSLAVLIFESLTFHHPLLGDKIKEGPPESEAEALKKPVYIYHPTDNSNRYAKYREFGGIPIYLFPKSFQDIWEEAFVYGATDPYCRIRETRWRRLLIGGLDTLVKCSNPVCPLKFSFLISLNHRTCPWCRTPIDWSKFKVFRFTNNHRGTPKYKVVYDGDWLSAHHCKDAQEFNFSSKGAQSQVAFDPQYGFTLRNTSSEPFLYCSPDNAEWRAFPPQKRIVLQLGCRVQFGASGTRAEVLN